jgi:hypothetical protein
MDSIRIEPVRMLPLGSTSLADCHQSAEHVLEVADVDGFSTGHWIAPFSTQTPGALIMQVSSYLEMDTDQRDGCRRAIGSNQDDCCPAGAGCAIPDSPERLAAFKQLLARI